MAVSRVDQRCRLRRPRRKPVGPWGHYVNDVLVRKGLSYQKAYEAVNHAAHSDGEKSVNYGRHSVRNWMGGTIPHADALQWIATGWDEPIERVSAEAEAHRVWRYEQLVRAVVPALGLRPSDSPAILASPAPTVPDSGDDSPTSVEIGGALVSALRCSLLAHHPAFHLSEADLEIERLDNLVRKAWHLRQTSRYSGLGELLPQLLGALTTSLAEHRSESDVGRLRELTVHTHNAASSLLRRLRADELAAIAADRALRSATDLDDPLLQASANYRLANVLLSARRHEDAKQIALTAASHLESKIKASSPHLAMWGGLVLTAAVAAARQHAGSEAWDLLGRARTAALWLGHDYVDLNTIFGPSNVAIHGVEVASDLGDFNAALEHGRVVDLDSLPGELLERRFTVLVNLAMAHQRTGDASTALQLLLEAERLAPEEARVDRKACELVGVLLRSSPGHQSELRALVHRIGLQ